MTRLRIQKFIFDLGGIVIAGTAASVYAVTLYSSDLAQFIQIAGPLFAGLATICGLALGFASVIVTDADKISVTNASEKLLHATLFLLFSSLLGIAAIQIEILWKSHFAGILAAITIVLRYLGLFFLITAVWAAHYGVMWLSDVLWTRWERREKQSS
jgi:hypothetical protein